MQEDTLVVTRKDQARALQDVGFLGQFFEPASPSAVGRHLGLPANLAHHHARRYADLGLLFEARREGGKVYYQLAARTFKYARDLAPPGDPGEHTAWTTLRLRERFLAAFERSDRAANRQDPDWAVCSFGSGDLPPPPPPRVREASPEARPAHFQARTVRLTPERYKALVRQVAALVWETEAEAENAGDAAPCTFAFLAFDGLLQEGTRDSHYLSTFLHLEDS